MLQQAHNSTEHLREQTENFVQDVVNVNEMLVESIKLKTHKSHNNSIAMN